MVNSEQVPAILGDPVLIALTAIIKVMCDGGDLNGPDMFNALCERALAAGVKPLSEIFDAAAELVDMPYSRELDIYCSCEMRDEARLRPFAHMPRLQ